MPFIINFIFVIMFVFLVGGWVEKGFFQWKKSMAHVGMPMPCQFVGYMYVNNVIIFFVYRSVRFYTSIFFKKKKEEPFS